jgi:hypothetical protein
VSRTAANARQESGQVRGRSRKRSETVATDLWSASTEIREGEIGCIFDETQSLVEPIERRDMDGSAVRSEAGCEASRNRTARRTKKHTQ